MGRSPRRRHSRKSRRAPRDKAFPAEPLQEPDTVSPDNRVRLWLDQLRACSQVQSTEATGDLASSRKQPWRPHNLPLGETTMTHHEQGHWETGRPVKDDILLPDPSSTGDAYDDSTIYSKSDRGAHSVTKRKRHPLPSRTTSTPRSEDLTFEKRPRRKTRDDRYDTKKSKRPAVVRAKRASKKHKLARSKLRSGREVMNNFVSAAIAHPKVTVRSEPPCRPRYLT